MKQFLAIYTGSAEGPERDAWNALDEKARKQREGVGMQAWMDWGEKHKGATIVQGGPLGKTKRVGKDGTSDIKNAMAGYIVVTAPSHEAAARMFENHPHFAIFPGVSVEIMECLPIPSMD